MTPERRALIIKGLARSLGFEDVGITDLSPPPHADELKKWLGSGMAASMTYMHRQAPRRLAPATIVPGATRAIVLTRNYFREDFPPRQGTGRVAKYARGADYHRALERPLQEIVKAVMALGGEETIARFYVDAGPVPERELAQRAGLGWIGKNTMLISPDHGSFFFLACVLTNLELALDRTFTADRCGSCRRCIEACPTAAFPEARVLDSRRCISYLTIEHKGEISTDLHEVMGRWVFGCDVCQDVCPWNRKRATVADDAALAQDPSLEQLGLSDLLSLSEAAFDQRFAHTALSRPGSAGMRRNACIVKQNPEAAGTTVDRRNDR